MVQPGQVLRFDLSDTSAAQLGGRAIAAESGARAQREAQAAQQATLDNRDARDIRSGFAYQSMLSRGLSEAEALSSPGSGSRPVQYMSQWDGVTRQTPIASYLQSTLGGIDPVRGSQWDIQVARSLPEAAMNEIGGLALAKALGAGAKAFNGVVRSEASLLNSELRATVNNALARELPLGITLEGLSTRIGAVENATETISLARRTELNAKFGRSGNLDLDINARGITSLRSDVDRLVSEGHAVGRHGERVTELALDNRVLYQFDPITGTTTDYFTRGTHSVGRNAAKFTTSESLLAAERYARNSPDFLAAHSDAMINGLDSIVVRGLPLEGALGSNYMTQVFGKARIGSIKNPIGTDRINFENGTFTSVFTKSPSGNWDLLTMYPEPK